MASNRGEAVSGTAFTISLPDTTPPTVTVMAPSGGEVQRQGAVEDHQWAPANGALKLIGEATGLLEPQRPQQGAVTLNRITVILSGPAAENAALMQGERETRVIDGNVLQDENEAG